MKVTWKDHIVSTPDVIRGKPRIKGTRIPASLRARPKITFHFRISDSGHLCPILIRKILEIARYSCGFAQSDRTNLTQI